MLYFDPLFPDPAVATAILDRLPHQSHVLTICGKNYHLRAKYCSGLLKAAVPGWRTSTGKLNRRWGQFRATADIFS